MGNGVMAAPANSFKVQAYSGMKLRIMPGRCFIEGRFAFDTEYGYITIDPADAYQNRIDRIVLRLDLQTRNISIQVKKGVPGASPAAPGLTRPAPGQSADVYELGVADVLVSKNTVSITQDKITDLRLSKNYCGIVTGLIQQADTTKIFEQYETYLNQKIAAWNSRENQQTTDWNKQMTSQQTAFDSQMAEIEGIYTALQTNIAALQTFHFDNLTAFPGCVMTTEKSGTGYVEQVRIAATGGKVAERTTRKQGAGYVETIKVYERDGVTVMKEFTITTTPTANGYRTAISGVYTPPGTVHPALESRVEELERTVVTKGNVQLIEDGF